MALTLGGIIGAWDYLKELIMRCRKTSGFSMVI